MKIKMRLLVLLVVIVVGLVACSSSLNTRAFNAVDSVVKQMKKSNYYTLSLEDLPENYSVIFKNKTYKNQDEQIELFADIEDFFWIKKDNFILKKYYFKDFIASQIISVNEIKPNSNKLILTETKYGSILSTIFTEQYNYPQVKWHKDIAMLYNKGLHYGFFKYDYSINYFFTAPLKAWCFFNDKSNNFAYIFNNDIHIKDIKGYAKKTDKLSLLKCYGDKLVWSPNDRFIFCAVSLDDLILHDYYWIYDTKRGSFVSYGGNPYSVPTNIEWAEDSSGLIFNNIYAAGGDFSGEWTYINVVSETVESLGKNWLGSAKFINNKPLYTPFNEIIRFNIKDSKKNILVKEKVFYEECYQKDFFGDTLQLAYPNGKITELDLISQLKNVDYHLPTDVKQFIPRISKSNKYLYLSIFYSKEGYSMNEENYYDYKDCLLAVFDIQKKIIVKAIDFTERVNHRVDYQHNRVLLIKNKELTVYDVENDTEKSFNCIANIKSSAYKNGIAIVMNDKKLQFVYDNQFFSAELPSNILTTTISPDLHNIIAFTKEPLYDNFYATNMHFFNISKIIKTTE